MKRPFRWAVGLALLVAAAAHAPGLFGGFVYDDHRVVEQNPSLDPVTPIAYLTDPGTFSAREGIQADVYRPLGTLDHALLSAAFGRSRPWPFHLVDLLIHLLVVGLVVRLAWALFDGNVLFAGLAGAVFAVHPAAVECVAWITSSGDLLAVGLMLGALLVLERPGPGATVGGALLGGLALLAKESALVLPALLLLRDVTLPPDRRLPGRTTAIRVGVLAVVVGAYLAVRLALIPGLAQVADFPGGSRAAAARGMLSGLAWYANDLVRPVGFPFDLHLPVPGRWTDPSVVLGGGFLVTLLLAGLLGLRRRSVLGFVCLGSLACLVPVSNVIVPLKALVAERFLYPVLVFFAVGVAAAVRALAARFAKDRVRPVAVAAVAVLVAVLAPVTWARTEAWSNDQTLWETVLRERPSHMHAYEGLGYEYLRRGRVHDAEIAYRSYLEDNPIDGKSMVALAEVLPRVRAGAPHGTPQRDRGDRRRGTTTGRVAELSMYRAALSTWARVGLVRGRGSPELLRKVQARRIEAAVDLGDLGEAEDANDALLRLDGFDPADARDVLARAPFRRRVVRLNLALQALTAPSPKTLAPALYDARVTERARVLDAVGIDPRRADRPALENLLERYHPLASEPEAGANEAGNLALLLDALGRTAEAASVRADARRRADGRRTP